MVVKCISFGINGIDGYTVEVEAAVRPGMPNMELVGLPDAAVRESRDRVRSALSNCGFKLPQAHYTINLAPADIRKEGPIYDLPITVNLLRLAGKITRGVDDCGFIGELSLNGELRPVNGVLPMVIIARERGIRRMFVPHQNAEEAAVVDGIDIIPVENITQLADILNGVLKMPPFALVSHSKNSSLNDDPDFSEVMGQLEARRAVEVAAAGGHNILLIGPPGSGKSMLAKRVPSILPDMTFDEMIETTKIHSISGLLRDGGLITTRPFRSPHHTVTAVGLGGGGSGIIRPGEVSLAHNGVLFLDELPEFQRGALEVLRQPIEDSQITISRSGQRCTYPCTIMVIAAMNPCPCGYFSDQTRRCTCTPQAIKRYINRVSGPLLDRFDIHVEVPAVKFDELRSNTPSESSAKIKERVDRARKLQQERFKGSRTSCNAKLTPEQFGKYCKIDGEAESILRNAFENLGFTARAYDRVLKVARTIADLDGKEIIQPEHVLEAIQYRSLDRKYWIF